MSVISFILLPLYRCERAVCTYSMGGEWIHKAGLGGVVNDKIPDVWLTVHRNSVWIGKTN